MNTFTRPGGSTTCEIGTLGTPEPASTISRCGRSAATSDQVFAQISELLPDATFAVDHAVDQGDFEAAIALLPAFWFPEGRAAMDLGARLAAAIAATDPDSPLLFELGTPSRVFAGASFDFDEAWAALESQRPAADRESYSLAMVVMDDRNLSDQRCELLADHPRRYRDARPITSLLAQIGAGRAFAFEGQADLLDEVASALEHRASELGSELCRAATLEMRGQLHQRASGVADGR